jgi:hypothetical protein
MAIVKVEKAVAKEAHEAKKLVKQKAAIEISSTKKLPRTPKREREETFGPFNPESEGGESTKKESSKGEASKHNAQAWIHFRFFRIE